MSNDLVWQLVKKNSRYLVKREGIEFTSEPNNLMNINSKKFSGLANTQTVGVQVEKGKISLKLRRKNFESRRKLPKAFSTYGLRIHMENKNCHSASTIKTLTQRSYYRPDLTKYAIARYHALHKSLSVKTGAIDKKDKRKLRGRKAKKEAAAAASAKPAQQKQ